MKTPLIRLPLLGLSASLLLFASTAGAQQLLLRYSFNEGSGTTVTNLGSESAGISDLTLSGNAAFALNSGVSGLPGDHALDLSDGSTAVARNPTISQAAYSNLRSFTVTGWFKTETTIGGGARLLDFGAGEFQLFGHSVGGTPGHLVLGAGGGVRVSDLAYTATNEWVFFAATFDGTIATASQRINFFIGGIDTEVTLLGSTAGSNAPGTMANRDRLVVGNAEDELRGFNGLMDDFRLYGETSGGAGALSIGEIESIRLAAIPEPSTYAAIAGILVLGLAALRRRRGAGAKRALS